MPLERDILTRIENDFSPDDAARAVELLNAAGKSGRVARCVVFAARGNLDALRKYVRMAEEDYRDVILVAEYDDVLFMQRLRDFSASFLVTSPELMWISPVANALERHGYSLTSVQAGPMNSGTATFDGELGNVTITRDRGQWMLEGDRQDLEPAGLWKAYDDEQAFIDALSSYFWAKRARRGGPGGTP